MPCRPYIYDQVKKPVDVIKDMQIQRKRDYHLNKQREITNVFESRQGVKEGFELSHFC